MSRKSSIWLVALAIRIMTTPLEVTAVVIPQNSGCGNQMSYYQTPSSYHNVSIRSGGMDRRFVVFIPPTYNTHQPTQLILSFHGGTKTAEEQIGLDKLTSPEFNTHSMVVYPQGYNNTWQGVPGRVTDDVQFTSEILDYIESKYCIDPNRIMSTGKSDGAGICDLLACNATLSRRIAAFAPVSGAYYVDSLPCYPDTVDIPCSPGRDDVPILAFHGGNDTVIAYSGGDRKNQCLPSITHWVQSWAARDCLDSNYNISKQFAINATEYSFGHPSLGYNEGGFGLVNLVYDAIIGHDWPSTAPNDDNQQSYHQLASFNATPMIMEFFRQSPLILLE